MTEKKILVTGALGQIGTELVELLADVYGRKNILATDISGENKELIGDVQFEVLDVTDPKWISDLVRKYKINQIINNAALLSAVGEQNPQRAWDVNMGGLYNVLEVAREEGIGVFTPSSIAAFGDDTPKDQTPQVTIQRPETIYGITKVAGELLSDYYFHKYGVDTRGVRYPGIISYKAQPGGGTTDYAIYMFFECIKRQRYESFIKEGTKMDMMYMPDALKAVVDLLEADPAKLRYRNAYNITAMTFSPEELAASIKKIEPEFELSYDVDPIRQAIAESWPNSLDDLAAREDWGWNPDYDLDKMSKHMMGNIEI